MACMKCGRDLDFETQVFCDRCLEAMAASPVKPGTVVLLPKRREDFRRAPVRRRPTVSIEERLRRAKRRNKVLALILTVLLLLNLALGYVAWLHFSEEEGFLPGQNYSSMETDEP